MRDIRAELRERARLLQLQICEAQECHDRLLAQARDQRDRRVAHLQAQIDALNRIGAMAEWHKSLQQKYTLAIAVLAAATEANQSRPQ